MLLLISTDGKTEPRVQFFGERTWQAQQIFGELDYSASNKNNGVNPSAFGIRVGYRF